MDFEKEKQPSLRGRAVNILARAGWPRVRTDSEDAVLASAEAIAQAAVRSAAAAAERWGLEYDDLLQEARLGVLTGYRQWDPARGRLDAWLARRAYQAVVSSLRWYQRREEQILAEPLEGSSEDDEESGKSRALAEVLADPSHDPDDRVLAEPRRRLARAIARAAAAAGEEAEVLLDRLVEAHEAGDETLASKLRQTLSPIVAAAMAAVIRERSAAALRRPRRAVA